MPPVLRARQRQVLEMLCAGVDRPEICRTLKLGTSWVNHICDQLLKIHDVPTVTALVAKVLGDRLARCQTALRAIEERHGERRG